MRKLIGFQIADQNGINIQGDDGDPTGFPSFAVMSTELAVDMIKLWHKPSRPLLLMPIFEGDVEEPLILEHYDEL